MALVGGGAAQNAKKHVIGSLLTTVTPPEFDARVSRCIAENASELDMISNNLQFIDGFKAKSLAWYILREARIAVEEEMDNERNHA